MSSSVAINGVNGEGDVPVNDDQAMFNPSVVMCALKRIVPYIQLGDQGGIVVLKADACGRVARVHRWWAQHERFTIGFPLSHRGLVFDNGRLMLLEGNNARDTGERDNVVVKRSNVDVGESDADLV